MPHLRIETNVPKESVPKELPNELSKLIAKLLDKSETYCCVTIVPDKLMVFGGTDEPCGQAILMSVGRLGQKENIAHSKGLFEKISKSLGISATRMFITFRDEKSMNIGYNGTTCHEFFGR